MANWTKEKATGIIKHLLRQADSESKPQFDEYKGTYSREANLGAVELLKAQAVKIADKYSINIDEVNTTYEDSKPEFINELGQSPVSNPFIRLNARTNLRKLWFEELAKIVAEGHHCKIDVDLESGLVLFFGFDLDREVATYMFLKLAEVANELCLEKMKISKSKVGASPSFDFKTKKQTFYPKSWMEDDIFIDSFHQGFREAIAENYSNHKIDEEKMKKVESFYEENRNLSSYNYWRNYSKKSLVQAELNESAYQIGRSCGLNVVRISKKSPSALTTKKSVIASEDTTIILIDRSGSMWGDKINQAIEGTLKYIETALEKKYRIGVIAFDDENTIITRPIAEVSQKVREKIEKLSTGNSTNLTDALKLAQSWFLNRNAKRVITIITDGMPTSKSGYGNGESEALSVANDCKRAGIEIMAIGTDGCNQDFLDKLTSKSGYGLLVNSQRLALSVGEMAQNL